MVPIDTHVDMPPDTPIEPTDETLPFFKTRVGVRIIILLSVYTTVTLIVWLNMIWDQTHCSTKAETEAKKVDEEAQVQATEPRAHDEMRSSPETSQRIDRGTQTAEAVTGAEQNDKKPKDEGKDIEHANCADCRPNMPALAQRDCFFRALWFFGVLLLAMLWPVWLALVLLVAMFLLLRQALAPALRCLVGDTTRCCGYACGRSSAGYDKADTGSDVDEADLEACREKADLRKGDKGAEKEADDGDAESVTTAVDAD